MRVVSIGVFVLVTALFAPAGCGDNAANSSAVCGNGIVDGAEQCDDGSANGIAGGSCTASCQFACETNTDCDDGNLCNGAEACTNHACVTATPPADGTTCGTGMICRASSCVSATCGDGFVTGAEECDDGNLVNGDGCEANCTFTCLSTDATRNCAIADACAGESTCNDTTHICSASTSLPDGTSCTGGVNNYCSAGVCTAPSCGNGIVEPGEDCDGGDGCTLGCTLLCTDDPATQCAAVMTLPACQKFACVTDSKGGQNACGTVPDTTLEGTSCDGNQPLNTCFAGSCLPPSVCGNGVRERLEQCDDGGLVNLDGCDSACNFEQDQRINALQQVFVPDDFCTQNALGAAIATGGQGAIQATWALPVQVGAISIVFKFLGLQDLTGMNSSFTLGFVNSSPVMSANPDQAGSSQLGPYPYDVAHNGNSDLEWWYTPDPASIDETGTPIEKLAGQVTNGHVTAGPGTINIRLLFAFGPTPADVRLFDAKVDAVIDGPITAPALSVDGMTPGHLASENLLPSLTSFASSSMNGKMCSNVSAASLANTPMPDLLVGQCTDPNTAPVNTISVFGPDNHLLDAFITGCSIGGNAAILPTQPDGSRDGNVYQFTFDSSLHVTGCTQGGDSADLQVCLDNATYSSYFVFGTDRVIIKR